MRKGLPHAPFTLSGTARTVAGEAIRRQCAHREWKLLALNVRTNHVHCVISARDARPEAVMQQLKSWATRWLRREGLVDPDQPVWARHGSTEYLWTGQEVGRARAYVLDAQ
jgi:REP element-mobilizing transposase RayT